MSDGYHRLLDMTTLTSPDLLALPIKLPGGRLSGKTKFLGLSYFTGDHRDYVNTSFKIGLPGRSGFQAIPRHMLYPEKQFFYLWSGVALKLIFIRIKPIAQAIPGVVPYRSKKNGVFDVYTLHQADCICRKNTPFAHFCSNMALLQDTNIRKIGKSCFLNSLD